MQSVALTETISEAQDILLDMPQVDCPVVHRFGRGIYIREVTMPTGTLAIGQTQKFEQNNFLLRGKIAMLTDDGFKILEAPQFFVGEPGKKIGVVLETIVWQNIWATDETDIDKLENMYMEKAEAGCVKKEEIDALESALREEDRLDYAAVIKASPFSDDEVKQQVENPDDQIDLPNEWRGILTVRKSNIHGDGMFLTWPVDEDTILGPARLSGKRTTLGRYANHSKTPNARPQMMDNGDVYFIASRNISGCKGGDDGEEITIDYRDALKLGGVE